MMIATGEAVGTRKFRIKFTRKTVDTESTNGTDNTCREPVQRKCLNGCVESEINPINGIHQLSDGKKVGPKPGSGSSSIVGTKRKIHVKIPCQQEKRIKMDTSFKRTCKCIINKLMSHASGWAFNKPVDPVALNIPDYYSIIAKPMDLGTIKSKLLNGAYSIGDEFAADVRLTFSNAMTYNPTSNYFHLMAKEISEVFETKWRSVRSKKGFNGLSKDDAHAPSEVENKAHVSGQKTLSNSIGMSKETDELHKLREELIELSKGKMSQHLNMFLKRRRLIIKNEDIMDIDVKSFSSSTLSELKQLVASCRNSGAVYQVCLENAETCTPKSSKNVFHKELSAKKSCRPLDTSDCKQSSIAESMLGLCKGKSDPDSDGCGSMLDEETACPTSVMESPTIKTSEDWVDVHLPHEKAARVKMLKNRFADTILKAQQKTLLDYAKSGETTFKKSEDEPKKEGSRIQVEAWAERPASISSSSKLLKREEETRVRREKQREAARMELEKMERMVEIDDNMRVLKDLQMLIQRGCVKSDDSPLEQLGLFIREDYYLEEDEGEEEEGEIRS